MEKTFVVSLKSSFYIQFQGEFFADCFYFFVCVCNCCDGFDGKLLYSAKNKPKYQLFLFFIKNLLMRKIKSFFVVRFIIFFKDLSVNLLLYKTALQS